MLHKEKKKIIVSYYVIVPYLHLVRISLIHTEDLVHAMAGHGFSMALPIRQFRLRPLHLKWFRVAALLPCDCDYDCDVSMKMLLFVVPRRYQTPLD